MRVLCVFGYVSVSVLGLQTNVAIDARGDAPFMLISGVTAPQDLCVVGDGGAVLLVDCLEAVAEGSGKELWQLQSSGRLVSASSGFCAAAVGSGVALVDCAAAPPNGSQWEALGSGQLKLAHADLCLTQQGLAPGVFDLAPMGAVSASSTASALHGADKVADNDEATYWASEFDPKDPVSVKLDLGASKRVQALEIVWEFPPKAFTVSVSDGAGSEQVFATSSNVLPEIRIALGRTVKTVTVEMTEPNSVLGSFGGHALYGIRSIVALGLQMSSAVGPCAEAARSPDARDKYFMAYTPSFDPSLAKAVAAEAPSLAAAEASLSAVVSELVEALPQLAACSSTSVSLVGAGSQASRARAVLAVSRGSATDSSTEALVAQARSTVEAARKVLA